ncbi:hypothetical protein PCLA_08r0254 [Pseudomonas citronellolis]|nr:hypothetical protein PCLA_08r0254 [Pseudomonas citronellolis]
MHDQSPSRKAISSGSTSTTPPALVVREALEGRPPHPFHRPAAPPARRTAPALAHGHRSSRTGARKRTTAVAVAGQVNREVHGRDTLRKRHHCRNRLLHGIARIRQAVRKSVIPLARGRVL